MQIKGCVASIGTCKGKNWTVISKIRSVIGFTTNGSPTAITSTVKFAYLQILN